MAKTPRLNYADASNPGLLSAGAQVIPGLKILADGVKLDDAVGQSTLSNYVAPATWSPTLAAATGSPSTQTMLCSYYTRIGNMVTITFYKSNFGNTSASVNYTLTLPVAISAALGRQLVKVPCVLYNGATIASTKPGILSIDTGIDSSKLFIYADATETTNFVANDTIFFTGQVSYYVA